MRPFSGSPWCGHARVDTLSPDPGALRLNVRTTRSGACKGCGSRRVCEGMPTMAKQPVNGFAGLLQRLRVQAGMTQEELARAAEVSPRTVSDLERGINKTARRDTAGLLADAMSLTGDDRERFLAAARGKLTPAERAAGTPGAAAAGPAEADDDADASN